MRKKVLTIIPILLLLVVIGMLASITVLILTKKELIFIYLIEYIIVWLNLTKILKIN